MTHCQQDSDCLERSGCSEAMAGNTLGRGDQRTRGTKQLADRVRFSCIIELGRRSVCVDVHHVGCDNSSVFERELHAANGTSAAWRWCGDVVSVGVAAGAENLAIDMGAAGNR